MKKTIFCLIFFTFSLQSPLFAVDFWHSNTVWVGQGQCSATFTFDSGLEEIENLQVWISIVDQSKNVVASGILEVEFFGQSSVDRYAEAFFEHEIVCEDDVSIIVDKAFASINNVIVDLLENRLITARNFKPFKIILN